MLCNNDEKNLIRYFKSKKKILTKKDLIKAFEYFTNFYLVINISALNPKVRSILI